MDYKIKKEKLTYKKKKKAVGGFLGLLASSFTLFFFGILFGFIADFGRFSLSLPTANQ